MITGSGIDIIKIRRIKNAGERWQERFIERIFTNDEIDYCSKKSDKWMHFAGRFSAKEAVKKALRQEKNLHWRDIEIFADTGKAPSIRFSKKASVLVKELGIKEVLISFSHCSDYAVAQAIAVGIASNKT